MGWDERERGGTSGEDTVTNAVPVVAYAAAAAGPVAFCFVNIWSALHDRPELRSAGRAWEVVSWEASSAAVTLALIPLVVRAGATAGPFVAENWRRLAAVHAGAAALFFLSHVGGFILIRSFVYVTQGASYVFGGVDAWLYELPKDLLTYLILAAILTAGQSARWTSTPSPAREEPAAFAIRDGRRTLLVQPGDIVAVAAAGNYVEFRLADGRSPLMRTTLTVIERELENRGIVRVHRSWLINPCAVEEITPVGGGDYRLRLRGSIEAPLSRRHASVFRGLVARKLADSADCRRGEE